MKKLILTLLILLSQNNFANQSGDVTYVDVNGLVCDFCARALEKVFSKQQEVESINVNLDDKIITINFKSSKNLDDATITKLITDSGYNVEAIRHEKP